MYHGGKHYPGEHEAVIYRNLWDEVAGLLAANRHDRAHGTMAEEPSLLAGMIFDADGQPLTPTHATKSGRRYRYYVSRALITESKAGVPDGQRIPAGDIEGVVMARLTAFLADALELHEAIATLVPEARRQSDLIGKANRLASTWKTLGTSQKHAILMTMSARVVIAVEQVNVSFPPEDLITALAGDVRRHSVKLRDSESPATRHVVLSAPASLKRAGIGMRMIVAGSTAGKVDPSLVKLLIKAFDLRDKLLAGHGASLEKLAARENINSSYATPLLAFFAPRIVRAILDGRHPPTLTARRLLLDTKLPLDWDDQLAFMH